ncbi:MAG: hypothetical protein AAGJ87_09990 [Pseudomonadota bacterium]
MVVRGVLIIIAAFAATACAAPQKTTEEVSRVVQQWSGNGYLSPAPTTEPQFLGYFDTEDACEAEIDAWMSRQVVGNPVFAECLPVDRR